MKAWLTQKELREVLGLSERQLARLCSRPNAPKKRQGSSWVYRWPDFFRWYGDERERAGRDRTRPVNLDEARKRKLAAEAELAELELMGQRNRLMTVEDYERVVSRTFARVVAQLKAMPTQHAHHVVGIKTLPEAVTVLQDVFRGVMEALHGIDIPDDDDEATNHAKE